LCGYGYEAFWTADHLREIGERNWGAPDAHNGYINLTLGVGAVGAVAHTLVLILGMWRSRANFLATGNAADLFPGCVVLLTAVNGLSVATQLNPHFMCFASMLALARLGFVGLSAEPSCCPELTGSSSPRLNWLPAESAAQPA
jgi:O-antigen ligase